MIKPARKQSETDFTTAINRLPAEPTLTESSSSDIPEPRRVVRGFKRVCYLLGASLFFALGVLGAILPGLPATPFLLLTSFFLLRTSPSLNAKLLRSRLFGPILRDWQENGGIRQHIKLKAIVFVILAIGLTLTFSHLAAWSKVTVALLACVGITVIVKLPTAE